MILEQEAQLNAPDPRESNPPCYEEALLMPKLERNFKSMNELSSRQSKRGLMRSKTTNDMNDNELILDSFILHSEEKLAERQNERTININAIRRTGIIQKSQSGLRLYKNTDDKRFASSYFKTKNLESAERIASFHSLERSPYSRRKPKPFNPHKNDNDDEITSTSSISSSIYDFNRNHKLSSSPKLSVFKRLSNNNLLKSSNLIQSFSSIENSPYCQRKPKDINNGKKNYSQISLNNQNESQSKSLNLIDDHFAQTSNSTRSNSKEDSNDFQIMNANDTEIVSVHSFRDSCIDNHDNNDPLIIIHRQSK